LRLQDEGPRITAEYSAKGDKFEGANTFRKRNYSDAVLFDLRAAMTKVLWAGILLMFLPLPIMLGEYLWALLSGAGGDRLAAAGFWGVVVAYYLSPVGLGLVLLGLVRKLFQR